MPVLTALFLFAFAPSLSPHLPVHPRAAGERPLTNDVSEAAFTSRKARITAVTAIDTGDDEKTTAIDVVRTVCDDSSAEPFYDSLLKITVVNDSLGTLQIQRVRYEVPRAYGTRAKFKSRRLVPIGSGYVPPGETSFQALFLDATENGKTYHAKTTPIPADLGFRNVTVTLEGRDSRGAKFTLQARTALSFDEVDRCP